MDNFTRIYRKESNNKFKTKNYSDLVIYAIVELQHATLPCLAPSPGAYSNSSPSGHCFHLIISSSVIPFSPCLQSFPESGSFPMSWLFIRQAKYWSFSFSISPPIEYSGLIYFKIDWFGLAVQGTLKSLLQHHHSKVSILWHSALFVVKLSHPHKTICGFNLANLFFLP